MKCAAESGRAGLKQRRPLFSGVAAIHLRRQAPASGVKPAGRNTGSGWQIFSRAKRSSRKESAANGKAPLKSSRHEASGILFAFSGSLPCSRRYPASGSASARAASSAELTTGPGWFPPRVKARTDRNKTRNPKAVEPGRPMRESLPRRIPRSPVIALPGSGKRTMRPCRGLPCRLFPAASYNLPRHVHNGLPFRTSG